MEENPVEMPKFYRNFDDLRCALSSSASLKSVQDGSEISEDWTVVSIVEWLQKEIKSPEINEMYRKRCTKFLNTLVKKYQVFPSSFFCNDINRDGDYPLGGGGFADVYKGMLGSRVVCLKVLRVHTQPDEKKRKKMVENFCQEALIWTQLNHPNVLQLLGVNTTLFKTDFCLVSPWMMNGDIITFLEKTPGHNRLHLILDIAAGMEYLHSLSPMIVHGDIRGANILVDEDCHCRLADFGLSREAPGTTMVETSTGGIKGSLRWMAPEMFESSSLKDPTEDRSPRDVYAYACTIVEIMTGKPPFPDLHEVAVMKEVLFSCGRPKRPSGVWCPDVVWELVEKCWAQDRFQRPKATFVYNYLSGLIGSDSTSSINDTYLSPSVTSSRTSTPPGPSSDISHPDSGQNISKLPVPLDSSPSRSIQDVPSSVVTPTVTPDSGVKPIETATQSKPESKPGSKPGSRLRRRSFAGYFAKLFSNTTSTNVHRPRDGDRFEDVLKPPPNETPEQAANRIQQEAEAKRVSDAIDEELGREKERARRAWDGVSSLLLAGQAESGKTTVLKTLLLHCNSASWNSEKNIWRTVIQLNIIDLLLDIVSYIKEELKAPEPILQLEDNVQMSPTQGLMSRHEPFIKLMELFLLPIKFKLSTLHSALAEHVRSHHPWCRYGDPYFSKTEPPGIAEFPGIAEHVSSDWVRSTSYWKSRLKAESSGSDRKRSVIENAFESVVANRDSIKALWEDEDIQRVFRLRCSSPGFFIDNLDRITTSDYCPTDEDIMHAYLPTSGPQDYVSSLGSKTVLRITDLAGHRNQRHAWTRTMEGRYNTIIFLLPLSTIDDVLEEEKGVYRLADSIELWRKICSDELLSAERFIVFLNKYDLLEEKLKQGLLIKKYITSYQDRPNTSSCFVDYVSRNLKAVYKKGNPLKRTRTLQIHITTATDTTTLVSTLEKVLLNRLRDQNDQDSGELL